MVFRKSDGIVERRIREERVLVPIAASEEVLDSLYTLNETAAFIWDRAAEGKTEETIASELAAAYEVAADKALADVQAVLRSLQEVGALEPAEE